jgi:hypothetical protein
VTPRKIEKIEVTIKILSIERNDSFDPVITGFEELIAGIL